ncbi:hypothetical protein ACFUPZ_00045 [Microbacterium oxydans]|uniref:hypothetical protein n=1 Tax=Microbacterium oxydans TaxID=82380 RepID=UPI003634DB6D
MTARHTLLEARENLQVALLIAEAWHDSYKKDKNSFALLVRLEAALNTSVSEYLHELADRAPSVIDWTVLKASGEPPASDAFWDEERKLLTVAVLQILTDITALGVVSGETNYGIPVDLETLEVAIMHAARTQTAELVRGATDTTRKLIREAVAQSIALGEDRFAATDRMMKIIDNPYRAQTIAQTEPVNAYQRGYSLYAKKTGAISKEWDGLVGACKVCSPLIGTTVGIDEMFVLANGNEVEHPSGHPRCRCSVIYNYE